MFTLAFWKAATERATRTLAQSLLGVFIVDGVVIGFAEIDWARAGWFVLVMTAASYLMSIVAASGDGQPSLLHTERLVNPPKGP